MCKEGFFQTRSLSSVQSFYYYYFPSITFRFTCVHVCVIHQQWSSDDIKLLIVFFKELPTVRVSTQTSFLSGSQHLIILTGYLPHFHPPHTHTDILVITTITSQCKQTT